MGTGGQLGAGSAPAGRFHPHSGVGRPDRVEVRLTANFFVEGTLVVGSRTQLEVTDGIGLLIWSGGEVGIEGEGELLNLGTISNASRINVESAWRLINRSIVSNEVGGRIEIRRRGLLESGEGAQITNHEGRA